MNVVVEHSQTSIASTTQQAPNPPSRMAMINCKIFCFSTPAILSGFRLCADRAHSFLFFKDGVVVVQTHPELIFKCPVFLPFARLLVVLFRQFTISLTLAVSFDLAKIPESPFSGVFEDDLAPALISISGLLSAAIKVCVIPLMVLGVFVFFVFPVPLPHSKQCAFPVFFIPLLLGRKLEHA
jgi:hypothetical protein